MLDYTIDLVDLNKEYVFLKKDINKQIKDCFRTQHWILGEKVIDFEKRAASYLGAKYAFGVACGTDALVLSLKALALKIKGREYFEKRDEIITTPLSFIATAESIMHSGATPVFVDIDPDTFNISPSQIKKAITKNTVGIIPVHLYGLACNMSSILKIAKVSGLFVLEDAAQAWGGFYNSKRLGTLGNFGAFSFFPSKNLGGFGDGGLIVTNDKALGELVKTLRNHGQKKRYNASYLGYNSRLDSIQAAVLLAKLKYVDKFNYLRRKAAAQYNQALKNVRQVKIPFEPKEAKHVYHLYTIKVSSKRDKLLKYLNNKGIAARIYYPLLLHKMKAFKRAKLKSSLKTAREISSQILSLPCHPFLTKSQIENISTAIFNFFNK